MKTYVLCDFDGIIASDQVIDVTFASYADPQPFVLCHDFDDIISFLREKGL